MTTDEPVTVEHILCDTTIVSLLAAAGAKPEKVAHWPKAALDRLDTAELDISAITFAELRSGQIGAAWPPRRVAAELAAISHYTVIPIDMLIVEAWAALDAQGKVAGGWGVDDNDLWIIATAQTRGWPVASCDAKYGRVPGLDLIYLPSKRDSRREPHPATSL